MIEPHRLPSEDDDPPPFLGAWPRVYVAVVIYLALLIVLFYLFAVSFTPGAGA
ncbi:MAG: hypothetical protein HY235_12855 [Acidobacteria bacterium]|nr:hypothetical protein [Acidobacteriota bacterium]